MRTAELELDDVTYLMEYDMTPRIPETRWQPAEGGLEIQAVYVLLPTYTGGPIKLRVERHDDLRALDQLIDMAYRQEAEAA